MRPGDDLDDRSDAVLLDPGHDAGEPVAGGLGDDRAVGGDPSPLVEEAGDLVDVDGPLAAVRRSMRSRPSASQRRSVSTDTPSISAA